ncbi:MAG: hypothetical protein NVSMB9_03360 [Isosphaeraceae bacterium]
MTIATVIGRHWLMMFPSALRASNRPPISAGSGALCIEFRLDVVFGSLGGTGFALLSTGRGEGGVLERSREGFVSNLGQKRAFRPPISITQGR